MNFQAAGDDPRDVQESLHQLGQAVGLSKGIAESFANERWAWRFGELGLEHPVQALELQLQRGEGRAKLMRSHRDEFVALAQRLLGAQRARRRLRGRADTRNKPARRRPHSGQ